MRCMHHGSLWFLPARHISLAWPCWTHSMTCCSLSCSWARSPPDCSTPHTTCVLVHAAAACDDLGTTLTCPMCRPPPAQAPAEPSSSSAAPQGLPPGFMDPAAELLEEPTAAEPQNPQEADDGVGRVSGNLPAGFFEVRVPSPQEGSASRGTARLMQASCGVC